MRMSAQKLWMFSQREVHQLQAPPTLLTCILKLDLFFIGVSLTCWDRKASRCSQIWAVTIRSSTEGWFIFTDPFKTRWIAHKIFSSSWKRSCLLSLPLVWPLKPAGRESASLWEGHQLLTKHTLSSHSPLQVVPHRIIWTMKLGSVCVLFVSEARDSLALCYLLIVWVCRSQNNRSQEENESLQCW